MIEVFVVVVIGIVAILVLAPRRGNRRHFNPRGERLAEANTSLVFLSDDESRAAEYEHRFSATRVGMIQDRRGYRVRKKR